MRAMYVQVASMIHTNDHDFQVNVCVYLCVFIYILCQSTAYCLVSMLLQLVGRHQRLNVRKKSSHTVADR